MPSAKRYISDLFSVLVSTHPQRTGVSGCSLNRPAHASSGEIPPAVASRGLHGAVSTRRRSAPFCPLSSSSISSPPTIGGALLTLPDHLYAPRALRPPRRDVAATRAARAAC